MSWVQRGQRQSIWIAIVALLLLIALACGPGEEATPTPTAPPEVKAEATVTPTPEIGPLATPTPTKEAAPAATPTPSVQPKRGGTLRLAAASATPNFDLQLLATTPDYMWTNAKVYSNLLLNYVEEVAECDICSEWHLENNGKTMVFTLIKGIKFHTGQELTSADVKYSLNMIMGEVDGIVSPRSGVIKEYIESIETPSAYVVRVNLLRPSPFMPKILANATSVLYREGTTREDLKKAPAGSGPFLATKIVSGASWTVERNPNYFKTGQPYLDSSVITIIVDTATRVASFVTGRTDMWVGPAYPPEQFRDKFDKLVNEGKVATQELAGGTGIIGGHMNNSKPPFDNLKLRQAVNLALDRERIGVASWGKDYYRVHLLAYTKASPYASFKSDNEIWNVVPGWGTGAKKAQEVEQAKQLVKEAGYANGLDVGQLDARNVEPYRTVSETFAQMLGEVGIRGIIKVVDGTVQAERFTNLSYSLQFFLFRLVTKDPDELVGQYWITGGARNVWGYSNSQVDKLFLQQSSELDFAKRKQLLDQIVDIIVLKDVAYAPLPTTDTAGYWWKRIQGVTIGQTMHSPAGLMRADRLWLEE